MESKFNRLLSAVAAGLAAALLLRGGEVLLFHKIMPLLGQSLAGMIQDSVCSEYLPAAVYTQPGGIAEQALEQNLGWYGYLRREKADDNVGQPSGEEEYTDEQMQAFLQQELLRELLVQENETARDKQSSETAQQTETADQKEISENMADKTEDISPDAFTPHTQQIVLADELLRDTDTVLKNFYTIDSNTAVSDGQIDARRFLETDLTLEASEEDGPQILIYHTHSQEAFADSVEGDTSTTIVGVGEYLTQILTETYGYRVLHHTGEYDVPDRDSAYGEALPAIEQILEDNPSIQVVIDLHRDQMDESTRLVTEVDGKPTAQFMFFNGLSYTKKTGAISYLTNENLEGNLAFSFQMQKAAAEYYPGLTRKIYLKGYRYNMHLRARTLLVELGAQNNTVEEAMNACEPLAHILSLVLQ